MASKIRNVVKVMNFHSLIRVDNAKRRALRYHQMEEEVYNMMDLIMNNRNLILDKSMLKPPVGKPVLTIYIGADMGFCSNYNSLINHEIEKNPDGEKIIIGKKLKKNADHVILRMDYEETESRVGEIEKILRESILRKKHSSIHIVYNRYINSTEMKLENKEIYPFELAPNADPSNYRDDFLIDEDVEDLLVQLVATYMAYQIQICMFSGYASENIMRQNTTNESLKKIDERDAEALMEERREKKREDFSKTIESFSKMKSMNGGKQS